MARKFLPCVLIVLTVWNASTAQDPKPDLDAAKADRRAKLLSAIEEDSKQLKLPENRAIVNARIAARAWKTDEELGRKLFRSAVNDLIAAQEIAEASKDPQLFQDLRNSSNIRPQVLNLIAGSDADLALDALYRTRPAAVERAMAGASGSTKISFRGNLIYVAQSEINLEQRLIRMAADQRPEKAAALLKEALKKKLSGETLNLLQKIYQKDPAAANELANDVLTRLISENFEKNDQVNYELLNLSNSVFAEFLREKKPDEKYIAFEESRVRRLAEKVIDTYLSKVQTMGWIPFEQLEPMARRFAPAKYEALRKATVSGMMRGYGHRSSFDPEYRKLLESNPAAETIVAAAKNFDPPTQQAAYIAAANKYSETGQYQTAVAMLNDRMEGDALENALSSMNWYYAHHLMQKGQYDAAESVMMEFNDSNRISALTSLAVTVFNANRDENRTRAAATLNRVRTLLPDRPTNQNEWSQTLSVINAFAEIEPAESFRMLELLIEQMNELTEAFAVVQAFQGGGILREREYVLANGFNFGVYFDANLMRNLSKRDPDRAIALVDGFSRREMRILLRLSLLEAIDQS